MKTKKTPLRKWLDKRGKSQQQLASVVGRTQGAISQMLVKQRDVAVVEDSEGRIWLEETRKIGAA